MRMEVSEEYDAKEEAIARSMLGRRQDAVAWWEIFPPWLFRLRTSKWQLAGTSEWPAKALLSWSYLLGPMAL